jgi:long-chain acyl-CoA synthetase
VDERPWHRSYDGGVPRAIPVPDVPLQAFLRETARRHPDRPAIVLAGPGFHSTLSYRALDRQSDRFAQALLGLGVRPGDRVAVALPNLPQYPIAAYGILKAGAALVQVNPLYREDDLSRLLADSGARILVTLTRLYPNVKAVRDAGRIERVVLTKVADYFPPLWRALYRLGRERKEGDAMPRDARLLAWSRLLAASPARPPDVRVAPDDLAVLQYTGGTTGLPRGAMLSHRNLAANAVQGLEWFKGAGLREAAERFLLVVPLFHVYGLLVLDAGIQLAATHIMVLMRQFDTRLVAEQVRRWQPTVFPGVPAMYRAVTQLKDAGQYGFHSIRLCVSGAAELPAPVVEAFERLIGGRLVEGYGLSEASPLVAANPTWPGGVRKPGSIGIPLPSTDARIVDVETGTRDVPAGEPGELVVRGPQVMRGYWNAPDETAQAIRDGWLYTGDIARIDADGYFFIIDRKKDMIDVGGINVYPREIEEALLRHPLVREAAVAGVKHPVRGETIVAHVVLAPDAADAPAARTQIRDYLRAHLAPYKVPRRIDIVESIPKTLIGKPLRRVIREAAMRDQDGADAARPRAPGEDNPPA